MTHSVEKNESELKAPEGGWGYIISVALVVNFICCISYLNSFGMLYREFYLELGEGTGNMTIVQGVASIVMSFSGILTNIALKKFTTRQVGIFGAVLYTSSWFLNVFTTQLYQMVFTFGFLSSTGMTILTVISFSSFNNYWVEKRVMMMSTCQMMVALGSMLCPLLLEYLLQEYGYRGCMLILSAIMANTILATACFQPVKWHATRNPYYKELPMEDSTSSSKETATLQMPVVCDDSTEDRNHLQIPKSNQNSSRRSSYSSVKDAIKEDVKIGKWKAIMEFMDISLLGDIIYVNITVGIAMTMFSDISFFLMYPVYLYSIGLTTPQVATCLTIVSAADLLSRAILALISKFHQFPSRDIFFISVVGGAVSKLLFTQCWSYWSSMVMTFAMGLFRGLAQLTAPLIYAEYRPEKFAGSYGLCIFFIGVTDTVLLPLFGYIRDVTGSYLISFYASVGGTLFCIIPWTYEYWYFKKNKSTVKK